MEKAELILKKILEVLSAGWQLLVGFCGDNVAFMLAVLVVWVFLLSIRRRR